MKLVTHLLVMLLATVAVLAHKGISSKSHLKTRDRRFVGHKSPVPVRKDLRALLNMRKRLARVKRQLLTSPPKSFKVEVKFKEEWLDRMADKSSSQYKLMDGNIADALATELIGDSDFLDSHVMTLKKSDDSTPKVLSDMQLNFVTEEQDPVKHLRAIVAQGRISGMAVYPDYFKILTDEKPPKKADSPANKTKDYVFDLKLKQDWYPFLSDQSSSPFKTLSDEIKKTIKQLFADDPNFIDTDVLGFTKDKDGHTHARIGLRFKPGGADPWTRLKNMVLTGKLGNIPVFDDYFNGQLPKSNVITPPAPPPMAAPTSKTTPSLDATRPPSPIPPTAVPSTAPKPELNLTQPADASTLPLPESKGIDGQVRLQEDWYPFLADHNSFAYKDITGTIEDAIKQAYAPLDVTVEVNGLSKDQNGKLIATFNIRFPGGTEPTIAPLQDALSKGFLGGLPVFSSSENITAPLIGIIPIGSPLFSGGLHAPPPKDAPTAPPAPTTPMPVTQALVTQAPVTEAPVTQALVTQAPVTQAPVMQEPVTQAPVTPAPVTTTAPQPRRDSIPPATSTAVPPTSAPDTTPSAAAVQNDAVTTPASTPSTPAPTAAPAAHFQPASTLAPPPASPVQDASTPPPTTAAPTTATSPPQNLSTTPTKVTTGGESPSTPLSDTQNRAYDDGLIPLPDGMPRSCADIRSSGIGTMDGEYVIQAKSGCHLNIICQNMNDPLPKEYLGGPQQSAWLYWHYAVLIKLSDYDKKHIADQACLEQTPVGRDFINKVMLAGARQGNPLIPFKTNIKHMINKFIGKAKKRRSMGGDITVSTRATKIYKRFAF